MKTRFILLLLIAGLGKLQAQSLHGFQSPFGKHVFQFSLTWDEKPLLGIGYVFRTNGSPFIDLSAEYRAPVDEFFGFQNFQTLVGMYRPSALSRGFVGGGVHLRYNRLTQESQQICDFQLQLTLVPSYVYAASLNDQPYGTVGGRLGYSPSIFTSVKSEGGKQTKFFDAHRFQMGAHIDVLFNRSLGLSLNPWVDKTIQFGETITERDDSWRPVGEFYFSPGFRFDNGF